MDKMSVNKRQKRSLKEKYDICCEFERGVKREVIISDHKLKTRSHLTEILKQKEKIINTYESLNKKFKNSASKVRSCEFKDIEEAVITWIRQKRAQRISLSSDVIRKTALSFAKSMGYNESDFKASDKWISGLKKRHNLLFTSLRGESDSVDQTVIDNWNQKLKEIINGYKPEDVYNFDETALFYKLMPNKSFVFDNESKKGQKQNKNRITIGCLTNADGSDRKLIIIGKSKNPRAFRNTKSLPLSYYSQTNAWMDSTIFEKIMNEFNKQIKKNNKKVLLFVDNFSAHLLSYELSNVRIIYFPANTTSVTQPLDQGIIHSLKAHYRKQIISLLISDSNEGIDANPKKIDLFIAMRLLDNSWKSVTQNTIKNCFRKAMFSFEKTTEIEVASEEAEEAEFDFWDRLRSITSIPYNSFESYVNCDDIEFVDEFLSDQEIVQKVYAKDPEVDKDFEDDISSNPEEVITSSQALNALNTLQKHFCQIGNSSMNDIFNDIQRELTKNSFKSLKQSKITDYLQ
jgi:hypothetical protein